VTRKHLLLLTVLATSVLAAARLAALPAASPSPKPRTSTATAKPGAAKPATKPGTTTPRRGTTRAAALPGATRTPLEQGKEALTLEEIGAYSRAAQVFRALRARVKPDGDLELALALDEARSGDVDSAVTRLNGALLTDAADDTMPFQRRRDYPFERQGAFVNGRFDGWHWYVWRARAELAAAQGRWSDALAAARQCVAARPLTGKEWLILAVAAGRVGSLDEARQAVERAAWLDPTLPEALYLSGLLHWRGGARNEAQRDFRHAIALDSTYREPGMALVRSRLPGTAPDSLPSELLTGVRRLALLTTPERPKLEEFVQMEFPASIDRRLDPPQDSLRAGTKPIQLSVSLLVDERGRAAINDLPWFTSEHLAAEKVAAALATLPEWRFTPARKYGAPQRVWSAVAFTINP
jgi:Flp pilus assembly protein TadD